MSKTKVGDTPAPLGTTDQPKVTVTARERPQDAAESNGVAKGVGLKPRGWGL